MSACCRLERWRTRTVTALGLSESPEDFLKSLTIEPVGSELMLLTLTAPTNAEAVRRLNALTSVYLEFRAEQLSLQSKVVVDGLQVRIDELRGDVEDLSDQIEQASAEGSSSASRLSDLIAQRGSIQGRIEALQQSLEDATLRNSAVVSSSRVLDPPAAEPGRAKRSVALGLARGSSVVPHSAAGRSYSSPSRQTGFAVDPMSRAPSGWLCRSASAGLPRFPRCGAGCPRCAPWAAVGPMSASDWPTRSRMSCCFPSGGVGWPWRGSTIPTRSATPLPRPRAALPHEAPQSPSLISPSTAAASCGLLRRLPARPLRRPCMRPRGLPALASDPADLVPVGHWDDGDDNDNSASPELADVTLILADLDPAVGVDHLTAWTDRVVVVVTAGRSSVERARTIGDQVRAAGLELRCGALLRTEHTDDSSGTSNLGRPTSVQLRNDSEPAESGGRVEVR